MPESASVSPSASPSESPSISPSASPSVSPSASPSVSPSVSSSVSPSASPSPIPAGEVSYTVHAGGARIGRLMMRFVAITFGSAYDKYPSGGISLTNSGLGVRGNPHAVVVLESSMKAWCFEWDRSANTIRIKDDTLTELTANVTDIAATTLELMVVGP